MNAPRERSAIVAAWLEEGPNELPESTRRAIAVDIRTTHQSRPSIWAPWRLRAADRVSLVTMAAVAVMALGLGGLAVWVIAPEGGNVGGGSSTAPSASPSASPASPSPPGPTLPIPAMTQTYVSERHGYSVSHPADWYVSSAGQSWSPVDWKASGSGEASFDFISPLVPPPPQLRAASAPLPEDLASVDDWIDEYLTFSSIPSCAPPHATWELIQIDGEAGRLRDSCGEVEATVVVEGRVYLFTLFLGGDEQSPVANGRALFDAFAATIQLRPEAAAVPDPSP